MDMIMQNADLIVIVLLVAMSIGIGYFLVPYLQREKKLSEQGVGGILTVLELTKVLTSSMKLKEDSKEKVDMIFEVTQTVVRYVEQTMKHQENGVKKENAIQFVYDTLSYLNISINEKERKLIELGIESAVQQLPSTK